MAARPNIYEPRFDDSSDRDGFAYRDAWLGHQAGAERLGASLYEIGPGQTTFPYHWHAANEELLLVVSGVLELRQPGGAREVRTGDVVAFPRGERGAHQLVNRSAERARFLIVSEMRGPDVMVYPDSGKVGVSEAAPGSGGEGLRLNFRERDAVDYWHGERAPDA